MPRLRLVPMFVLTVVVLAIPGTALAQEYPNVGDNNGGNVDRPPGQVLDREIEQPAAAPGAAPELVRAAPAEGIGGLAVTGGDIAGMTAIALACIAVGVALRRRPQPVRV